MPTPPKSKIIKPQVATIGQIQAEHMANVLLDPVPGLGSLFPRATPVSKERLIVGNFGEVGTYKTSWWLGAPEPIFIANLDRGTEGVVDVYLKELKEKTGRDKQIYVQPYESNTHKWEQADNGEGQAMAEAVASQIERDIDAAIKGGARSIVIDKETQMYATFKYATLGAPTGAPSNYYALFQRYTALINRLKDSNVNVGLIQGMKEPWVSEAKASGKMGAKPSGTKVRNGMPQIDELVHINIEHVLVDGQVMLNVGKVRGPGAREVQNRTISYVDFATFASVVFPHTNEEDWL